MIGKFLLLHVTAGWVRAISTAQNELKKHPYGIHIPILLMYSASSYQGDKWSEDARKSDSVLDVADIKHYGCKLGLNVTPVKVNGGLHDFNFVLRASERCCI